MKQCLMMTEEEIESEREVNIYATSWVVVRCYENVDY